MTTTPPPLETIPVTALSDTATVSPITGLPPLQSVPVRTDWQEEIMNEPMNAFDHRDFLDAPAPILERGLGESSEFTAVFTTMGMLENGSSLPEVVTVTPTVVATPPSLESLSEPTSSGTSEDRSLYVAVDLATAPVGSTPEMSLGLSSSPSLSNESSRSSIAADPWAGHDSKHAFGFDPVSVGLPSYPEFLEIPTSLAKKLKAEKAVPSSDKLQRKKGYYIVPWLGKFHYYKIGDPAEVNQFLYKFTKRPDTDKEGFVVVGKDLFYVTYPDLIRNVIRKSRKIEIKSGSTYADLLQLNEPVKSKSRAKRTGASNTVRTEPSSNEGTVRSEDKRRLIEEFGLEVVEGANMAFERQELALHDFVFEEE